MGNMGVLFCCHAGVFSDGGNRDNAGFDDCVSHIDGHTRMEDKIMAVVIPTRSALQEAHDGAAGWHRETFLASLVEWIEEPYNTSELLRGRTVRFFVSSAVHEQVIANVVKTMNATNRYVVVREGDMLMVALL